MRNRIRSAAAAVLFLGCLVTLTSAFNLPNRSPDLSSRLASLSSVARPAQQQRTTLTLADRVAYQRAIEEVYWRHRIWPKERPDPKPSLDEVMPSAQLEKKVADYLRKSQALEDYWQRPITAQQLQAEMTRMAEHTKQPDVLRELFDALGNDPFVIAECLARPALTERLLTNWYAYDQGIHGELKQRAETELQAHPNIEQMKQLSGTYSEIELTRREAEHDKANRSRARGVELTSRDWDETVRRLVAAFHTSRAASVYDIISTGKVSSLQEDEAHCSATAVIEKTNGHLKLTTVSWSKEPLESWLARVKTQVRKEMSGVIANYMLPAITAMAAGCTDDTWTATASTPTARIAHTAVWTGSEMIVWGGYSGQGLLNTGGKYSPSTDSWVDTTTNNAPDARWYHTAVWTGTEMIVWGGIGNGVVNTGGRYNPGSDSWTATSTINAPSARYEHTAVWTGTEMIVWGGYGPLNTGGRYNPNNDSWTATSTTNAPQARRHHTAVWTGSEMIIWGGYNGSYLYTGGRYNPATDTWTPTSTINAPSPRDEHTAVWTGTEMIVWGGRYDDGHIYIALNSGGRYDPNNDTWTATGTGNVPLARYDHTAVWTGSEMIVWGGIYDDTYDLNTGGRYNPATNSWTATSTISAPGGLYGPTAVWTGSEMIVWGGNTDLGGRYNPITDSWLPVTNVPSGRYVHTAVWTGSEMIVWGGVDENLGYPSNCARYNPIIDSWTATSAANAPAGRAGHTAVWTGTEMIAWGGCNDNCNSILNTGGKYNPETDSWIATSTNNAPEARFSHTGVWTGSEMIVWGGLGLNGLVNNGGRYNPGADNWTAISSLNAPTARYEHTAVWVGTEMIVWGGEGTSFLNTGGRYNPTTDAWIDTTTINAPDARIAHTAVWSGTEMLVWGGTNYEETFNTGGRYNPVADSWTATSTTNAPSTRDGHTAVWTGSEMIVWGGFSSDSYVNTGGRYNSSTDSWTATSTTNAPFGREGHTAVWTGSEMIIWGGIGWITNTGGRYCAQSQAPMAQSAFSRKIHGGAGTFDVPLPLTGNVGVECRSGGATNDYQMIINFATSVTVESASVTSGAGSVSSFSVSGSQVTVNLTGVTNVQTITVTLHNVNDGTSTGDIPVSMGVLVGDVNGNAAVNASDVSLTKSQVGQAVSGSNFREDVNANGVINSVDIALVKSKVGTALPP